MRALFIVVGIIFWMGVLQGCAAKRAVTTVRSAVDKFHEVGGKVADERMKAIDILVRELETSTERARQARCLSPLPSLRRWADLSEDNRLAAKEDCGLDIQTDVLRPVKPH